MNISLLGINNTEYLGTTEEFNYLPLNPSKPLDVIGNYLNTSLLTSAFRNSNLFTSHLSGKSFKYQLRSGTIDLSSFTDTSQTFTLINLRYVGQPLDNSNIEVDSLINGTFTVTKEANGLAESHYDKFTATLIPTSEISITENGSTTTSNNFTMDG